MRKYASASKDAAKELVQLLTDDEVETLSHELAAMQLEGWINWQITNEKEIYSFVSSTPEQREKQKRWRDPELQRLLVLGAITHCLAAYELLSFFDKNEYVFRPGGSYRDTTAMAGRTYWEIRLSDVPHWPKVFERICDSPFVDTE